jgi:chromosome segregation ATPase
MNNRIGIIILLVICLGLGVAVVTVKKRAADQHDQDARTMGTVSNELAKVNTDLTDQRNVNSNLEKDIADQKQTFEKAFGDLTNSYTQVASSLANTETSLRTAEQTIKDRDTKIANLEAENQALDQKAAALSNSITNLNAQIDDTRHKLAASEGDKAFLEKELKRMMTEKAELERQFNDISVLRAQVAKLREEQNIARRMEWSRQGLLANSDQKGAQQLMQGLKPLPARTTPKSNYDLNVEVSADGSVRVVPPATNNVTPANQPVPR